jgi:UDPglucose 6-dehydrogenase
LNAVLADRPDLRGRVAIIGYGYVGKGMHLLFPDAYVIDPAQGKGSEFANGGGAALAVICVPTPMSADGSCDTSIVESVVRSVDADVVLIKSTVTPGTCDRLAKETGKRLVFSPEYMGEGKYWMPARLPSPTDPRGHGFCILGGDDEDCSAVQDLLWPVVGPATRFRFMGRLEAELVKYFENTYFAMKVTFSNEIRKICEASGANYHRVREGWLDDPRVEPMHTAAFAKKRGFDGKCLPKDTAALAAYCRAIGAPSDLLEAILAVNGKAMP